MKKAKFSRKSVRRWRIENKETLAIPTMKRVLRVGTSGRKYYDLKTEVLCYDSIVAGAEYARRC